MDNSFSFVRANIFVKFLCFTKQLQRLVKVTSNCCLGGFKISYRFKKIVSLVTVSPNQDLAVRLNHLRPNNCKYKDGNFARNSYYTI
jgi:hypothetical protein